MAERRREQRVGDSDRRVVRLGRHRLAIELEPALETALGYRLFRLAVGLLARALDARKGVALAALEQPHGLLVLELLRIFFERLLKALESPARAILLDVAQAELEARILRIRLRGERLLELTNRLGDVPLLAQDRSEENASGGHGSDLDRARELLLRAVPVPAVGEEGAEREMRQEGLGLALDRTGQQRLRLFGFSALRRRDPGIDQ